MQNEVSFMVCPYCHSPMEEGSIMSLSGGAIYWLPITSSLPAFLSKRTVEQAGGNLLGDVTKIGFFAIHPPKAYFCIKCHTWLIQRDTVGD